MAPVDQRVEVPIIEKRVGQVLSLQENNVQIMDLESYDTFEIERPSEEDVASKLAPGARVEYWVVASRRKIVRVVQEKE